MLILSQSVLALASLFAALLLYRQPLQLTAASKAVASIVAMCCLLIFFSALLPIFIQPSSEGRTTLLTMLINLQQYLALPLLASIVMFTGIGMNFSKGAWGRWSLVLLAIFELCRRAQIGEYYSAGIAISSCILIAIGLLYRQSARDLTAIKITAIASLAIAVLVFSTDMSLVGSSHLSYYNYSLALALCLICFCFGKNLSTTDSR